MAPEKLAKVVLLSPSLSATLRVMLDNAEPQYLSMAKAARHCPGTNGRPHPHPSALFRWCRHGLKSRSGRHVRLKHVRCGRGLYTTVEWLHGFFDELATSDLGYFQGDEEEEEEEALGRASQELDRAGL